MSDVSGNDRVVADRYRLLGPLGEGGTGIVWRARDEVLGREVAVREVRAPAGMPAGDVRRLHTRLEREARAAARVSHRNAVAVHDVALHDSRPWIVMELIRGLALSDVLDADGPLPSRRAARIGAEVIAALRAGHEAGVLHRDVRPGNVLLANDGRVMLTDFGIAAAEEPSSLTGTGEPVDSPEFLAPERALGRAPVPESDLWSLGVLLFAATEGRTPFVRDTPADTLRAVIKEETPVAGRAGALALVIEGLLRKDPDGRLTAGEAEHRLRILAAGGTGPAGGGTAGPPPPPAPDPGPGDSGGPEGSGLPGGPAGAPDGPAGAPERPGRAALLLVAAVVAVVLLAVGAVVWALSGDASGAPRDTTVGSTGAPHGVSRPGTHGEETPADGTSSPTDT
ncbi:MULTISPECIES: serine/threonine-protein kinase [unclassified Streptomyces]|uniref:serine/threonine-protein kinase n=1 Tax=unclassified Streptomyces TaxID=2593676 RepID=UPI0038650D35